MQIIKAGYEILDELNGSEILKKIERVARVCYKSEDKITEGSAGIWTTPQLWYYVWAL